jgi:hypothetical protein
MGALSSPLGLSDLEFPFESDLIVCRSSSPCACVDRLFQSWLEPSSSYGICQFSSPFGTVDPLCLSDLSYFEFPSDEAILEAMTMVSIP